MSGCNNDCCTVLPPLEVRLWEMKGNWEVDFVSNKGVDVTSEWTGFTLTFTENKVFITKNSADLDVWPQTGTFEFAGETQPLLNVIIRSDGHQVNIDYINNERLDLSCDIGVKDQWVFKLKK